MKRLRWRWQYALIIICWAGLALAGIHYDAGNNRIWVTDYPAAAPCNLSLLARIDRICGWHKVHYDASNGIYQVNADLCVGADDGTETYFDIGSPDEPRPCLVLNGNLFVCPCGTNSATGRVGINRLTLGSAVDSNINAVIQVDCATNNEHSVYIGVRPEGKRARGLYSGQLHMFNSRITALVQDAEHALGAPFGYGNVYLAGDSIRIQNSEISWCKGCLTAGLVMHLDTRIENSVLAHAKSALCGYKETPHKHNLITGCVFRDCETVVQSPHTFLVITDCRFERNRRNWTVDNCREFILVGCEIQPPLEADLYGRTAYAAGKNWQPQVLIKRRVQFIVQDQAGRPVPNAAVAISGGMDGERMMFQTDAAGVAGVNAGRSGILLTARLEKAVEGSSVPEAVDFQYDIRVQAAGYQTAESIGYYPWRGPASVAVKVMPQ